MYKCVNNTALEYLRELVLSDKELPEHTLRSNCGTEWTLTLEMPQTTQYLKANLKPSYSESAMLTYFMMFNQFFNCK